MRFFHISYHLVGPLEVRVGSGISAEEEEFDPVHFSSEVRKSSPGSTVILIGWQEISAKQYVALSDYFNDPASAQDGQGKRGRAEGTQG